MKHVNTYITALAAATMLCLLGLNVHAEDTAANDATPTEVTIPENGTADEYFALMDKLQKSLPDTESVEELIQAVPVQLKQIKQLSEILLERTDATAEQYGQAARIRIMSLLQGAKRGETDVLEKILAFADQAEKAGQDEVAEGIRAEQPRIQLVIAAMTGEDAFLPEVEKLAAKIEAAGKQLDMDAYAQALTACHFAETILGKTNIDAAMKTNADFAQAYDKAGFPEIADIFQSHVRRLELVGKEMKLTGKTLDGKDFDLATLKGKTVFLYFSPDEEIVETEGLLKLRKLEELAGPKGLQVVGIMLSDNLDGMHKIAADFKIPWPLLQNKNTNVDGRDAVSYYGIRMFPCVFIIGKDGNVLSTNARPAEIRRLLTEELGALK